MFANNNYIRSFMTMKSIRLPAKFLHFWIVSSFLKTILLIISKWIPSSETVVHGEKKLKNKLVSRLFYFLAGKKKHINSSMYFDNCFFYWFHGCSFLYGQRYLFGYASHILSDTTMLAVCCIVNFIFIVLIKTLLHSI